MSKGIFLPYKNLIVLMLLCFFTGASLLYAQSSGSGGTSSGSVKFQQRLEWNADDNALEYKIEIRQSGKTVKTYTTAENYVELNLPSGSYEYRVSVYDFLGRVQDTSEWQRLEISKASIPAFENMQEVAEVDISSGDKIVLPMEVENVAAGTTVKLVNINTGEIIAGELVITGASGKSETGKASAEFSELPAGEWKLVVENPSGLKAESPVFTIKTVDREAEALARAEREAREAAEREAAEKEAAEREAAKREAERLAREEAEREELARQEELKRQEELARQEELEKEKELEAASEELDNLEESEEPEELTPPRPALGLEVKAGAALAADLFGSDIFSDKNKDWLIEAFDKQKITLAPYAALSFVPNPGWVINPGVELSANYFSFSYKSDSYLDMEYEYQNDFNLTNIQLNLIGQIRLHPQKFFLNIKAGGGLQLIQFSTSYVERDKTSPQMFIYPKVNAGLSLEAVPFKHLVFEAGADYNMVISSKVKISYLSPYLVVGVRF